MAGGSGSHGRLWLCVFWGGYRRLCARNESDLLRTHPINKAGKSRKTGVKNRPIQNCPIQLSHSPTPPLPPQPTLHIGFLLRVPGIAATARMEMESASSYLQNTTDQGDGEVHVSPQSSPPTLSNNCECSKSERIITLALLRKRSEHNEGLVSSLEELALHQEELQSIGPVLGRTCGKTLKILLLQNNVIERMKPAELKLLRSLEYLNLALNNVTKVEGISGMEWLRKLDLTLNFIDVDALEESVDELSECRSLEELFLLGNPCMGVSNEGDVTSSSSQDQLGWEGCRAYIVARLSNLQSLDGKEIKRSERLLAMQQLPTLTLDLHLLAESRIKERQIKNQATDLNIEKEIDEGYISDDAPTHHNPETRTKISDESYRQKHAKEKEKTANQAPKLKGEKDWEEDHFSTVTNVRKWEGRGRERESSNLAEMSHRQDDAVTKQDGGIKQCNQGKYQFWFEEECAKNKKSGLLIMRVAIPKYLSTSLIDVDIHPTYVSVIVKSKVLRVVLPVEVLSHKSVARRIAASGHLELVMVKVHPNEDAIGLGHVRDVISRDLRAIEKVRSDYTGTADNTSIKENRCPQKRERLGKSLMKAARVVESLKIVSNQCSDQESVSSRCDYGDNDDGEDEPPLLM
jgi:protein TilB